MCFLDVLSGELAERAAAKSLLDVLGCEFYDPRQKGQLKRKTLKDFIDRTTDPVTFEVRCPIDRCGKIIQELSDSLELRNIGANTLYCPHCSSPINFAWNHALGRYNIQYWDSRFDILQRHNKLLIGLDLECRYDSKRRCGVSIIEPGKFYLDFDDEAFYVGNELSSSEFCTSNDLAYFSLRKLDYIALKHQEDFLYLKEKLHEIDPETNKSLYYNIELLHSGVPIESVEPTLREIGGNEMLIATGATFFPMFFSNIMDRRAVLEKQLRVFSDREFREEFKKALRRFDINIEKYRAPRKISYRDWQQSEGGFASLFLDTIKPPRAIGPLWINDAIRNESITPNDFVTERGKRYEKFYYIEPKSHAHDVAKRVSKLILRTKIVLLSGAEITIKQLMEKAVFQLKKLLNQLSTSSVDLFVESTTATERKISGKNYRKQTIALT